MNTTNYIFDPLTKVPTVSATGRSKRSDQTGSISNKKKAAPAAKKEHIDFFAKGNEHLNPPTVYSDAEDWSVRVILNKFPIFDHHEVIIHSPSEKEDIDTLDIDHVKKVLRAYVERTKEHNSEGREVFIFNNRGKKAGASLVHPHSQLVAEVGLPGTLAAQREASLNYHDEKGACYWCDLLKGELESGERVVFENDAFVALVPAACRWSYEVHLLPKRHSPSISTLIDIEIDQWAEALQVILQSYDNLFDTPDRNFWIMMSMNEPFHWHMEFIPQIKTFAGLELGAGIWVSDKANPEDAAKELFESI